MITRTTERERERSEQIEYYIVKWDATRKADGKAYRAATSPITNKARAEKLARKYEAENRNPEIVTAFCAFFL